MIDREHELPLASQAVALNISRGSIYYEPMPTPATDLAMMRQMDELHLEHPFASSRMLRDLLAADGNLIGRRQCHDIDEENGHRSGLSEAQYFKVGTGAPDLSLSVARTDN